MQPMTAEEILAKLVSFDTTSSDSNIALIEWVEQYLDQYGVHHERVQEHKEDGIEKTSLLACIGPEVEGGIVLSGHTDVVPTVGQQWHGGEGAATAYTLAERDGKLYARGAADMKGFLALALAEVPKWAAQNAAGELKRPVWLAFSHDEEVGCKCAEPMAKEFIAREVKPALIVAGEPTMMQVVDEHKGIDGFETVVTGKAGHSSAPELGVNAAYISARLALKIEEMNLAEAANPEANSRFPTPHSTLHLGMLHAGTARNVIPNYAPIYWEVRPLPGVDVDTLIAPFHEYARELEQQYPGCTIETTRLTHVHGLKRTEEDVPHLALASYIAGSNEPTAAVSYGTEGGAFGYHGLPTVICGPGSIEQAHGPDEFISRAQFDQGKAMMARVGEVLRREQWVSKTTAVHDPLARER